MTTVLYSTPESTTNPQPGVLDSGWTTFILVSEGKAGVSVVDTDLQTKRNDKESAASASPFLQTLIHFRGLGSFYSQTEAHG